MPGESEVLELKLSTKDLASFVTYKGSWIAESGNYKASVGASSADIKGQVFFSLPKEIVVEKVKRVFAPDLKFEDMKP